MVAISSLFVALTALTATVFAAPTPDPIADASPAYGSSSWKNIALQLHNQCRSARGIRPLKWSTSLQNSACACAQRSANAGRMNHCGAGENMWMGSGRYDDASAMKGAITSWNAEKKYYKGQAIGDMNGLMRYGHYTQVMWKSTGQVGCCAARGRSTVVVCKYANAGNYRGQRPY
ncbi:hypothetical protein HK104_002875 [Borealophlyctis nickersoniae]|nr:hypothetical protein HK104_002875 [Borealophlyctis nickersoniae]